MRPLIPLLRRIREKPVGMLARHAAQRLRVHARRSGYWQRLRAEIEAQIASVPGADLRKQIDGASQLILPAHPDASEYATWCANEATNLRFGLLGARLDARKPPLPWRSDWRVGHEWPRSHHASLGFRDLTTAYDVKYPWELSRFLFAPTMALASQATAEPRYEQQLLALAHEWDEDNPVAYSINWASALEVALRAVHLACTLPFLRELPERELRFLLGQIAIAAAFVRRNLEYSELRGNHYIGNLYGLLICGLLLRGIVGEAGEWVKFAAEEIQNEVLFQFAPDGVNFEGSVPYHRFSTEMCLFSFLAMQRAGIPFRKEAQEHLQACLLFLAAAMRPDGTLPLWGDNDDANALHLADPPCELARRALGVGAVLFRSGELKGAARGLTRDARLLLGDGSQSIWDSIDALLLQPRSFRKGGFLIASKDDSYLIFDVGGVGLRGRGGHGHNDALSFELWLNGTALIIDAGMPSYSGDVAARNHFRSTGWHNTALVNGQEQATLFKNDIWRLGAEAEVYDIEESHQDEGFHFSAAHRGFERLPQPVGYRRQLWLAADTSRLEGVDRFTGRGRASVELPFHFDPKVKLEQQGDKVLILQGKHGYVFSAATGMMAIRDSEISPAYGRRVSCQKLVISAAAELPFEVRWALTPAESQS